MLSRSVTNCSIRIRPSNSLSFSPILNNIVDSASPSLKPLAVSNKAHAYTEVPDLMFKIEAKIPYFSFYFKLGTID